MAHLRWIMEDLHHCIEFAKKQLGRDWFLAAHVFPIKTTRLLQESAALRSQALYPSLHQIAEDPPEADTSD